MLNEKTAKRSRWWIDAEILNQMRYPMHRLHPILQSCGDCGMMDLFQCVGVREADAPPSLLSSEHKNSGLLYSELLALGGVQIKLREYAHHQAQGLQK